MFIKLLQSDCSACEKISYEKFMEEGCPFFQKECKCKTFSNGEFQIYKKLTVRRLFATIVIFVANRIYLVAEKWQQKYEKDSYILGSMDF